MEKQEKLRDIKESDKSIQVYEIIADLGDAWLCETENGRLVWADEWIQPRCSRCGTEHMADDMHLHNRSLICVDCFDAQFVRCDGCDKNVMREDVARVSTLFSPPTALCSRCYEGEFCMCDDCEAIIEHEDSFCDKNNVSVYCADCAQNHEIIED